MNTTSCYSLPRKSRPSKPGGGLPCLKLCFTGHGPFALLTRADIAAEAEPRLSLYGSPGLLVYGHTDEELCRREVEKVYRLILDERAREDIIDFSVIGPVPAFASRVRGRYRWQLFFRSSDPDRILSHLALPQGWTIDVDLVGIV